MLERHQVTAQPSPPRILVAGMGNVLRGDDGFGVEVARRLLASAALPANVQVVEVGIGGISLVQELMAQPDAALETAVQRSQGVQSGYDILILIDAVQRAGEPGQLYVLEAAVPTPEELPETVRRDFFADMHYATPNRALMLAQALHVLPPQVYILGCQPALVDDFDLGLSPAVEQAVPLAIDRISHLIETWQGSAQQQTYSAEDEA